MSSRPILGINNPESQQQGSATSAPPSNPAESPLASGLAAWDLLPSDTLLVRRRPAKK